MHFEYIYFFWKRAGTMGMTNYRMIGTQFALRAHTLESLVRKTKPPCGEPVRGIQRYPAFKGTPIIFLKIRTFARL